MTGYQPDSTTMTSGQLVHAAVHCLVEALDAEGITDPLQTRIVSRFLTGTTPEEQAALRSAGDAVVAWTPEQQQAARDALLTSLAAAMGVTEDEALRQIGEHWSRPDA